MFHPDFRTRKPVLNDQGPELRNDRINHIPGLIGDVMDVMQERIELSRAPLQVSDEMAALLCAAVQRRSALDVKDPFGIYVALLRASPFVLRDIYNQFLTDDSRAYIDNPDLTKEMV